MTELVRHHSNEGYRAGVIVYLGRIWMKIHYVANATPTRMKRTEERHMSVIGEVTPKQRRIFNKSVVTHGGKRGAI